MAAEIEADAIASELPLDDATQLARQWELADPRDRWRWTGEAPPSPEPNTFAVPRLYSTTPSVIDAFWYVVRLDDPDYLARWLAQHPADVPHLHEIWGRKCATAA